MFSPVPYSNPKLMHANWPVLVTSWFEGCAAYARRNEYQLTDSVQYFMEALERVAQPDYVPTLQDILFCRKTTKGVIEFRIEIDR